MPYKKIVSLTPSITETLFALGAGERVVGVTDACDFPPEANSKTHVCSWFDPDLERITGLGPDLVLGLATAHRQLAPRLQEKGIKCTLFNPVTVADAISDMISLGALLGITEQAALLRKSLKDRLEKLAGRVALIKPSKRLTVSRVLEIDGGKLIVAGPESFQYDVIKLAGGENVTTAIKEAYPVIAFQTFKSWNPDVIFFCGTDRSYISRLEADPYWSLLTATQNERIYLFDCGLTCRTGPRIVDMAELLFQTVYA